jgi:uncharacterized Ntn-hydrolase superfamily protein
MTYSIVAHDRQTGSFGVAVQSHWFSVGSVVIAAAAGVGAVATQANPDLQHKPRALALLRTGMPAQAVAHALLADDPVAAHRQLGIVDARGGVASHTGESAIAFAGQVVGDGFAVQANMMRSPAVWPAMAHAYEQASGDLTSRLLATLDAAEAVGGDVRGRQSAAILVVPATGTDADTIVDLRVEDSPDPLGELRRLVGVNDAYVIAAQGDELLGLGDFDAAARAYVLASELAPANEELRFWAALGLIGSGGDRTQHGLAMLRGTIALDPSWRDLLGRLGEVMPASIQALELLRD